MKVVKNLNYDVDQLTLADVEEMKELAINICLNGFADVTQPIFVDWCMCSGLDDRQGLLMYGLVFPQRLLIAVTQWYASHALGFAG